MIRIAVTFVLVIASIFAWAGNSGAQSRIDHFAEASLEFGSMGPQEGIPTNDSYLCRSTIYLVGVRSMSKALNRNHGLVLETGSYLCDYRNSGFFTELYDIGLFLGAGWRYKSLESTFRYSRGIAWYDSIRWGDFPSGKCSMERYVVSTKLVLPISPVVAVGFMNIDDVNLSWKEVYSTYWIRSVNTFVIMVGIEISPSSVFR